MSTSGGGGPALLGVLSLQQKSQEQKRSKKQKELDSVPDPEIDFMDVKAGMNQCIMIMICVISNGGSICADCLVVMW